MVKRWAKLAMQLESVRRNVERQPLAALAIAGAIGYVFAMFIPRHR